MLLFVVGGGVAAVFIALDEQTVVVGLWMERKKERKNRGRRNNTTGYSRVNLHEEFRKLWANHN